MRILVILCLICFTIQCTSSSKSIKPRGKLGDVMEKAADDYEGERTVETEEPDYDDYYDEEDETEDYATFAYLADSDSAEKDSSEGLKQWFLGFKYEFGLNSRDYFLRVNQAAIGFGVYGGHSALFGYIGYGWDVVNSNTTIGRAVKSPLSEYLVGFEFHYYTTPEWTLIGHKLFAGFVLGNLTWDYKNPINIVNSDEIIKNDSIGRLHLFIGTGINITQTKYFNLGGYAKAGGRFYSDLTNEEFENDIFKTEGFVSLGLIVELGKIR